MSRKRRQAPTAPPTQAEARQVPVDVAVAKVADDSTQPASSSVVTPCSEPGALPAPAADTMAADPAADVVIELPSTFDAASVREMYASLRQTLSTPATVRIDGTKVDAVDTAAAQLLAAFALTGHHVRLTASQKLADLLTTTAIAAVISPER